MPVDDLELFDAADDTSKDDSSDRKRSFTHALLGNMLDSEEEESVKRQKTDTAANRKLNSDQWDTMFSRLVAYKAEKGVSKIKSILTVSRFSLRVVMHKHRIV
jgi:hypothetical protein